MIEQIFLILFAIAATGAWIAAQYIAQQQSRRKLGESILEVRQHSRWSRFFQRVAMVLAVGLPAVATTMVILDNGTLYDLWMALGRSLWFCGVAFSLHQGALMLVGERGISVRTTGGAGIIRWDDIREIRWDRDIGQTQWGITLVVRRPKGRTENVRFYLHRKMKEEVEQALGRYAERSLGDTATISSVLLEEAHG